MPESNSKPADAPGVPTGDVRAELEKILAAQTFANSGRQSRFLRFVVEETLAGRGPQLKEYLIGVEVYDRGEGYDPRVDTIVRVEASRLRSRLAEYYRKEGAADPVRIDLPRGSYVPAFTQAAEVVPVPAMSRSRNLSLAAAGAVILLFAAVFWMMHSRPAAATAEPPSVAVLPFTDLSPEHDQEYFCDGMTEELITALSRIDGLRVAARTSSFEFKGMAQDVRSIGTRLHVAHVLEGSVRKDGGRLRITAQLITAGDGYHVWSATYDRDMKDVFAVQEQIAHAIASNLQVKLAAGPRTLPRTGDLEAYNLFLQGKFFEAKFTPDGEHKAIELYEQAIARDPQFAGAYSGLADTYLILGFKGMLPPQVAGPKALAAACRAIDLNQTLADPHVALGALQALYHWNWSESEKEFRRALELEPGSPSAHSYYGSLCLTPLGRLDEALHEVRLARDLDPLSREANSAVGLVYYYRGEYDQAIEAIKKTIELDPGFGEAYPELICAYEAKRQFPEALAAVAKLEQMGDSLRSQCLRARIDAAMGKAAEARTLFAKVEPMASQTEAAALHAALGERDQALHSLEKAIERHDSHVIWLNSSPQFRALRSDPRFLAIARSANLPVPPR